MAAIANDIYFTTLSTSLQTIVPMEQQTEQQIVLVITQRDNQKKYIPYLQELDKHPLYGDFFHGLEPEQRDDIQQMLRSYIIGAIQGLKTK